MARSDFVADFLTVIRNASQAKKDKVTLVTSNLTTKIAEILKEEGFVTNVKSFTEEKKNYVRVHLKYVRNRKRSAIQGLRRISTPGLRVYKGHDEIPKVQGGLGVSILSSSKGVVSDRRARKDKLGGELLCEVW